MPSVPAASPRLDLVSAPEHQEPLRRARTRPGRLGDAASIWARQSVGDLCGYAGFGDPQQPVRDGTTLPRRNRRPGRTG
jgi:hypothetical protein